MLNLRLPVGRKHPHIFTYRLHPCSVKCTYYSQISRSGRNRSREKFSDKRDPDIRGLYGKCVYIIPFPGVLVRAARDADIRGPVSKLRLYTLGSLCGTSSRSINYVYHSCGLRLRKSMSQRDFFRVVLRFLLKR